MSIVKFFTKAALAAAFVFLGIVAFAQSTVTLTSSTGEITLTDGQTLTGTGGAKTRVIIADGATITLSGVNIAFEKYDAGITCEGDATIVLAAGTTNTVVSGSVGITVAQNHTLTIMGTGTLNATGYDGNAGIGAAKGPTSDYISTCGNIIIREGTIRAQGGSNAAGIGAGDGYSQCGNIFIYGGNITATGGYGSAGIGTGAGFNSATFSSTCGDITIVSGTITATKGRDAAHSIGIGLCGDYGTTCGTVTVAGAVGAISTSTYSATIVYNTYTVSFDPNGGTGSMSDQTVYVGVSTPLNSNNFSRDGYVFVGWSNTSDGDVAYANRQSVMDLAAKDGTKTLYAKWMSNTIPTGLQIDNDYLQTQAGFYYVNLPDITTTNLTIDNPSFGTFKVYDDGGKNGAHAANANERLLITAPEGFIINLSGSVNVAQNSNTRLYIYDKNTDQNATYDDMLYIKTKPPLNTNISVSTTGRYMLISLSTGANNNKCSGLDFTVTLSAVDYSITYKGTDGATFATANPTSFKATSSDITLVNPTMDGFWFLGWTYEGQTSPTKNVTIPKGSYGDKEFTANWVEIKTLTADNIADIPDKTYNGSAIDPEVVVTDGENTLTRGTDYTVTYTDNVNAGTSAKVTITGVGAYAGEVTKTFTINPKEISISWGTTTLTYNGAAQAPTATAGNLIGEDVCTITVTGAETNVGNNYTATASELSNKNYAMPTENLEKPFVIEPKEITITWSDETTFTYDGDPHAPTATLSESLIGEDVCTITISGAETNVGDNYTATASLSNDNYTLSSANKTKAFSIVAQTETIGAITFTTDQNGKNATINGEYNGTGATTLPEGGIEVDKVTINRNFTSGAYSTIVLPFDAIFPDGMGTFYTFQGVKYNENGDSKWTAYVQETSYAPANTPFIFEPEGTVTQLSWNASATKIKLNTDKAPTTSVSDDYGDWTFTGTYQKKVFGEMPTDQTYYGFAGANEKGIAIGEFVHGTGNAFIRPFRCYLAFDDANGLSKSAVVLPSRIEVRVISSVIDPADPEENPNGDIETPTSELIKQNVNVWSFDKIIYIAAAPNTPYTIVDVNGRPLQTGITATDRDEVHLSGKADGIVIVIVSGKSFKIRY
ncbi:MAG: InlB B-repeat-containing protein [Bacteroidales bacterium]|nr:InlB B-repeat-containing protein [Bacteroidales bacterium]